MLGLITLLELDWYIVGHGHDAAGLCAAAVCACIGAQFCRLCLCAGWPCLKEQAKGTTGVSSAAKADRCLKGWCMLLTSMASPNASPRARRRRQERAPTAGAGRAADLLQRAAGFVSG